MCLETFVCLGGILNKTELQAVKQARGLLTFPIPLWLLGYRQQLFIYIAGSSAIGGNYSLVASSKV